MSVHNASENFSGFCLSFDQGVAIDCGVNAAVTLNHIIYWLRFNEKNPDCQKNGKIWMYETQDRMAEFFKFYSKKEVRDYIKILLDKGYLVKDNFNGNPFDHKSWYSLSDDLFQKVFSMRRNCHIVEEPAPPDLKKSLRCDEFVASDETNSSHQYKDKEKEKKNKLPGLAGPESEPSEKLFYQDRNGLMKNLTVSEVFTSLGTSGFEANVITSAIEKFRTRKGKVGDPLKLIALMCEDIQKETTKAKPKESVYKELKNPTKLKLN